MNVLHAAVFIAVSIAVMLATTLGPTTATAQSIGYDYGYSQQWWKAGNKKAKPQRRQTPRPDAAAKSEPAVKAKKGEVAEKPAEGPLVLVVSLRLQRVTVYDSQGVVATSPISSGRVGNPTPPGVYTILEKQKMHYSNLYGSAPMPNMQRLTWSGVALHAGVLPGYPASHGCIRLPHGFSQRLYSLTKSGARVIVTRDDVPVQPFSHQTLFTSTAFDGTAKSAKAEPAGEQQIADASGRMVGVTGSVVAAADPVPADAPKVSAYRQKWLVEMDRRAQALTTALAAKDAATTQIAFTAQATEVAKSDFKTARLEAERTAQSVKKAEAERGAAEKDMDAFAKGLLTERRLSDDQVVSSVQREEDLDTKLSELTAAVAAKTTEAAVAADVLTAVEQRALKAEADRKAAIDGLTQANADLKTAQGLVEESKRREAKRQLPVAIFVSRQTKKLYVRQAYAPILEVPVEIADADKPFGTHVYTALSMAPNNHDVVWSVASVPTPGPSEERSKDKKRKNEAPAPVAPVNASAQTPAAALDRIKIPDDAREQIADVLKPGSSLLISDYGLSNETGLFTDFIVNLR